MYPKDVGIDVKHEMDRRQISCNLLGILIDTNMARAAKSTDIKVRICLHVVKLAITLTSQDNILPHGNTSTRGYSENHSIVLKYIRCN